MRSILSGSRLLALRRARSNGPIAVLTAPAAFALGKLAIDRATRRVTLAGRPVRLTAIEHRLLHALSLDADGGHLARGPDAPRLGPGKGDPQAARSTVRKLRRRLGDDARNPKYIVGERGWGIGCRGWGMGEGRLLER